MIPALDSVAVCSFLVVSALNSRLEHLRTTAFSPDYFPETAAMW